MAFWMFLGLVPLVAILGWALARFAGAGVRQSVVASLVAITPQPALRLVDEHLRRLVENGEALAPLSLVGFLWIASGGVHTAMVAVQVAQDGRSRAWWRNRLAALGFVIGFLLVVTGSTAVLVLTAPPLEQALANRHLVSEWLRVVRWGTWPTAALVATVGSAMFFRISAHPTHLRKRVMPGAIVSGLSWVAVTWGFSTYAKSIGRFPIFYGSLAAVALLMLWLWLSCFLLLLGFELNLQLEGTRQTIVPRSIRWLYPDRWGLRARHPSAPSAASPSPSEHDIAAYRRRRPRSKPS
jgi:membrane protein